MMCAVGKVLPHPAWSAHVCSRDALHINVNLMPRRFGGRMYLSRRDSMKVARHEVPGVMRENSISEAA